MCKLNILCELPDGKCNCTQKGFKAVEKSNDCNGLLCSILSYIRDQPEIMKALSESSNLPLNDVIEAFPCTSSASSASEFSPTQSSIVDEGGTDYSIHLLSDLPSKVLVGRSYSIMAEVTDKKTLKASFEKPLVFKAVLVGENDREEKFTLSEVETSNGTLFFRKIVFTEVVKNVCFEIRAKDAKDVAPFTQKIQMKARKNKDEILKRTKSIEIGA